MTTTQKPRVLGALPASPYHRPHFRYFAPVDGGEGATPTDPPAPPAPESAAPAEPPAPPADPAAEETPPWSSEEYDREKAWKKIQAQKADLDAERAKRDKAIQDATAAATQQAREEAYREIGKTFGLVKEDEAPTVEGLQAALQERDQTLTASESRNLALTVENAVLRYADKHGADADALSDSSSFTSKLKALDPAADDYASQVEELVKSTTESHSRYRKVQVAPKSSDGDPSPAGGAPTGEKSIDDIRKERQNRRGVTS